MANYLEIVLSSDEEEEEEKLHDIYISEKLYHKEKLKLERDTGFEASFFLL